MNREIIIKKLDLVIDKLLNLDEPDNKEELKKDGESRGFFKRDFGFKEWDWPQGVGMYGLFKAVKQLKREHYKSFMFNWYKNNIKLGLGSKNINTTAPLLALVMLNEEYADKEFENLTLDWADWLMNGLPRTRENGFQHVTSANGDKFGVRLNENELWIDTIFMSILFLNKMGNKYNNKKWIEEGIHQVLIHIKYLYDKKNGLFFHGWTFNKMNNFGEVFWCRGNGWFSLGILDYIEMFEGKMDFGIKTFLFDTFKAQMKCLKALQSESGLLHTVLDDKESYEEVSGSAAILAGMIKGVQLGILEDEYIENVKKGIDAILKNIDEEGIVKNVSGGTGMGHNKEHYKNILIAPMAYGQSLTIIALVKALEILY